MNRNSLTRIAGPALAAATLAAAAIPVAAQPAPPRAPVSAASPSAPVVLRVATGKAGKGFSRVFADLQAVCGRQVALSEIESEGGLQNISLLAANRADLGFVQADTIQWMREEDKAVDALKSLMPMNSNLLHVVARTQGYVPPRGTLLGVPLPRPTGWLESLPLPGRPIAVEGMANLAGLPVAVVGSARSLARELNRLHKLDLRAVDVATDQEGLAKLARHEVAALLTTSGWPSGPVQALRASDQLHLVPFDMEAKAPYHIAVRSYENINSFRTRFLAAPNLLVTRPFSAEGPYGRSVATLRECLYKNLTALREGPYEPMWQELKPD